MAGDRARAQPADLGGAGVLLGEWTPAQSPTWNPSYGYVPSAGGAVNSNTNNYTDNSRPTFNIKSTDPKGAADEVSRRLTRDAQSKAKL